MGKGTLRSPPRRFSNHTHHLESVAMAAAVHKLCLVCCYFAFKLNFWPSKCLERRMRNVPAFMTPFLLKFSPCPRQFSWREEMTIIFEVWQHLHIQLRLLYQKKRFEISRSSSYADLVFTFWQQWMIYEEFFRGNSIVWVFFNHQGFYYYTI